MDKPDLCSLKYPARWSLFLVILVLQTGCASLPPALTYANYVLSSITYISTSKGPSDIVLSRAVEKDCSLMRALFFKPVCKPVTETSYEPLAQKLKRFIDSRGNSDDIETPPEIAITMNTALDDMINATLDSRVSMNAGGSF